MGTDFWLLESPLGSLGLPIKADKLNSPVGCCTDPEVPPGWPVGKVFQQLRGNSKSKQT